MLDRSVRVYLPLLSPVYGVRRERAPVHRRHLRQRQPPEQRCHRTPGPRDVNGHVMQNFRGDTVRAAFAFYVDPDSPTGWVFNPTEDPLLPRSAELVMYNQEGRAIRSWGDPAYGSRKEIVESDWLRLGPGTFVGTTQTIVPFPGLGTGSVARYPSGKYRLRVIYRKSFIGLSDLGARHKVFKANDGQELAASFDKCELFHSNGVEIELTN